MFSKSNALRAISPFAALNQRGGISGFPLGRFGIAFSLLHPFTP